MNARLCWLGFPALCCVFGVVYGEAQTIAYTLVDEQRIGRLKYEERVVSESSGGQSISYVIILPGRYQLKLAVGSAKAAGSSLARYVTDGGALAALNGGFLASYAPATPAGFVQQNHVEINDRISEPVLNGLVCFEKSRAAIEPISQLKALASQYSDCLQAGPLLVDGGKASSDLETINSMPRYKNFASRFAERSFVAITKNGEIVIGVTSTMSLFTLRDMLTASRSQGGLNSSSAVGLTGRSTAGLIFKIGVSDFVSKGRTDTLLPNAILVTR